MSPRMSGFAEKLIMRVLRRRLLPLFIAVALFAGLVSTTGYILWQTKIKEEFPLLAKFAIHPLNGEKPAENVGQVLRLVVSKVLGADGLSTLAPGQDIQVGVEREGLQTRYIDAQFIHYEKAGSSGSLLLNLQGRSPEEKNYLGGFMNNSEPMKINLTVRRQRLLSALFKKGAFKP